MSVYTFPGLAGFDPACCVPVHSPVDSVASATSPRIGILNLMSDKAQTERQFIEMFRRTDFDVALTFLRMSSYTAKNTPARYLEENYLPLDAPDVAQLDAIVVTGAPLGVRFDQFEDVAYWPELVRFYRWVREQGTPLLGICWGAQAMLYLDFAIPSIRLHAKKIGLYRHTTIERAGPLTHGLPESFVVPVARKTTTRRGDLDRIDELSVLCVDDEDDCFLVQRRDASVTYVLNHIEYDRLALAREYARDVSRGLDTPRPRNYFVDESGSQVAPDTWTSVATRLFGNWAQGAMFRPEAAGPTTGGL